MENVNWGIIGCGDVCEVKSGPAFYKTEHSALVAVMRRDEAKAKDFALRHHVGRYYTDADQLINDPQVDIVYVATPPSTHMEYAIKAMQAGKPVYVEKPMAISYDECKRMIEVSEQTGQKLFVAYYRRSLPYFEKIKEIIDNGIIGKVLTANVQHFRAPAEADMAKDKQTWRVNKAIGGGGHFVDMAPHTLDILDFLLGAIEETTAVVQNQGGLYEVEDTVSATFRFRSGCQGTGQWCFVSSGRDEQDLVEIRGTKGTVRFGIFNFVPVHLTSDDAIVDYEFARPDHIQQHMIQTVVNELRGVGHSPSTGITAARTSKVIDAILACYH